MKLRFLTLPADERGFYIEQASLRRDVSTVVLEKDFWVCWLLAVLFDSKFADVLVFKGGTSLSKVFGVIERFSEDIDLSVSPAFLGISEESVEEADSRSKRTQRMKDLEAACIERVRDRFLPELERIAVDVLGKHPDGADWMEFQVDAMSHSPVVLFHYPDLSGSRRRNSG